jgi:anti-anti-sigma factor
MDFSIKKEVTNVTFLSLSGDFNICDYKVLKNLLQDITTEIIVFDFSKVNYVNSSMFDILIKCTKQYKVHLCNVSNQFLEIAELLGLNHILPLYHSKEQIEAILAQGV